MKRITEENAKINFEAIKNVLLKSKAKS